VRVELTISGMLAVHARHAVFTALSGVEGIVRADVELGRAVVECEPGDQPERTLAGIREAIRDAGFAITEARVLTRTLPTL
jgi:copper chaperone CopZ